jgi:NADH dehydrogenase [ubiquinone] 1 alpha subcomplex assembly factor 7
VGGAEAGDEGEGDVTAPSDLAEKLAARIRRQAPLSVAQFMTMALHDPDCGYYARRDPIGRTGDFITAPEISQIFGELIGLCLADWWQRAGRPRPVILAELGPGRGTLMADLLRAAATVPNFRGALDLYLIEASPRLREAQQRRLADAQPQFAAGVDELPPGPLLLVANEFLDALPIRQFVRGRAEWAEQLVGLDAGGRLVFAHGPESPAATLLVPERLRGEAAGTIVEICPAAMALAAALGSRLTHTPGLALFVDYGHGTSRPGATLAAVRRHAPASVLDDPGECDLSAHVDFAAFAAAARAAGAIVHGPVPQREFLLTLGAEQRFAVLAANATPAQREVLQTGLRRLIAPQAMGGVFHTLALTSPDLPAPAGFA